MRTVPVEGLMAEVLNIQDHPGYTGAFTTDEANGAMKNGTRVMKFTSEAGDLTPTGTHGSIRGSLYYQDTGYFYFIEWDNKPKTVVGCTGFKLRRLS
jgi:hypothetical protein